MRADKELQLLSNNWVTYICKEKHMAQNTVTSYSRDLKSFVVFLSHYTECVVGVAEIKQLMLQDFRAWLTYRGNLNISSRSNARAISTLRSFFKYLADYHNIHNTAIFNLSFPIKRQSMPRGISKQDAIGAVKDMSKAANLSWIGARDLAVFMLLYGCGLRISEVLSLNLHDIIHDSDKGDYIRVCGKGDKERIVPLLSQVERAITDYISMCPFTITKFIFFGERGKKLCRTYFAKRLRLFKKASGLPEILTAHSMRHSFATHLLSMGVDIRFLQELLGHSDLASTQIYTKVENQYLLNSYVNTHPRK